MPGGRGNARIAQTLLRCSTCLTLVGIFEGFTDALEPSLVYAAPCAHYPPDDPDTLALFRAAAIDGAQLEEARTHPRHVHAFARRALAEPGRYALSADRQETSGV